MKRLTAAAIILSLVSTTAAIADEHRDHGGDRGGWAEHRDSDHRDGDHQDHNRWQERREWQDRDHGWHEARFPDRDDRRAWVYREHEWREHDWRRGERLPGPYFASQYVIGDYVAYGLPEPPYGCRWIRVNNDVVLTALATGVVLDVVYNAF